MVTRPATPDADRSIALPSTEKSKRTRIKPSLSPPKERILLLADSFAGKTFGVMMMAERVHRDWKDKVKDFEDRPRFYLLDLDDRMGEFLGDGKLFAHLREDNGGPVHSFSGIDGFKRLGLVYKQCAVDCIKRPQDWIVIDSLSELYEMAQDKTAGAKGKDLDDAAFDRALNDQGFGAFEANEWTAVKMTTRTVTGHALHTLDANVLFLGHLKNLVEFHNKGERQQMFGELNQVPTTPAWFDRQVATIAAITNEATGREKHRPRLWLMKDGDDRAWRAQAKFKTEWYQALLKLREKRSKEAVAEIELES